MNTDTERTLSFRTRMVRAEAVQTSLAAALEAQTEFLAGLKEIQPLLHPTEEIGTLKALISREHDAAVINQAVTRINELSGDGAKAAQERAKRLAVQLLGKFQWKIKALVSAAESAADELIAEAVRAEKELFETYGYPYEPTSLSENARGLKRTINSLLSAASTNAHLLALGQGGVRPAEYRELLAWFKQ